MTYHTIDDVKIANRESTQPYWFSPDTLRFFGSRIGRTLYDGRYFLTSEQRDHESPRRYTIRQAMPDGTIETVGEFQAYATRAEALMHLQGIITHKKGRCPHLA